MVLNLVFAAVAIVIILVGAAVIFDVPLSFDIPFFSLSLILAIAEIFSLGLVLVALVRTRAESVFSCVDVSPASETFENLRASVAHTP